MLAVDTASTTCAGMPVRVRRCLRVGFLLASRFTLSAFSLFIDTLQLGGGIEDQSGLVFRHWDVLSSSGDVVRSSCGIHVAPTAGLGDPSLYDYLVVVGGPPNVEWPIDRPTRAFLRDAAGLGVPIIGLCTASFILAEEGLLDNRVACVSWLHCKSFKSRFPNLRVVLDQLFVEDRKIITCAGGSAVADVAAFLVRKHIGFEAEKNALEILHIERRRSGTGAQSGSTTPVPTRHDRYIRASLLYMEQCLDKPIDLHAVAQKVGVSRRQLERIFAEKAGTSPREALTRIRMDRACLLLESTTQPITNVALDVGFENSSHFTKRFREIIGVTPSNFRQQKQGCKAAAV